MPSTTDDGNDSDSDVRPAKRVRRTAPKESDDEEDARPSGETKMSVKSSQSNPKQRDQSPVDASDEEEEFIELVEETGDIFDAPDNTLIIHACNCEGSWGAGIARAFKQHYPKAFRAYKAHCNDKGHGLMGFAQLIPPMEISSKPKHFVGCLFTSRRYGKAKDKPIHILEATEDAMLELNRAVTKWNDEHDEKYWVGEVRICKINSGMFKVPWKKSYNALRHFPTTGLDIKTMKVIERES